MISPRRRDASYYKTGKNPAEPDVERDWLSLAGARELKQRIESYWADRGRAVVCRVEPLGLPILGNWFVVRSNLDGAIVPDASDGDA